MVGSHPGDAAKRAESPVARLQIPPLAWIVSLFAAVAVSGWAFQGEFLLNWDQVIGPEIPVPPGLWGLGPELPRRTPFYVPLALVSQVISGPKVIGLLLVASTMSAVVGAARLSGSGWIGLLSGLVYGLSPFILSRAAVGHLPLVVATAMLPWLLFQIGERSERSLMRWAVAYGFLGSSGAVLGLVPIVLAALAMSQTMRMRGRALALLALSQAAWFVPGLVAVAAGVPLPTSQGAAFDLNMSGAAGLSRVVAGGGLFLEVEDVAYRAGLVAALLGLVLLGTGVAGLVGDDDRSEGREARDRLVPVALLGTLLVFLPSLPLLGDVWTSLVDSGPFGVLRESQKFWPLLGLALVTGLANLLRSQPVNVSRVLGVVVVVLVLGSAQPGLFGAEGRLAGIDAPEGWVEVSDELNSDPGRTVVFPWERYGPHHLSDGRTVLQPVPWILPGTVLTSGDVGNFKRSVERSEGLESELLVLDQEVRAGQEIAPELRHFEIRWVLILRSNEAGFYGRLGREEGVEIVVDTSAFFLLRIDPIDEVHSNFTWVGSPVPVTSVAEGGIWDRPCERGWLINFSLVPKVEGRCQLPPSGGVLWYPPAVLALVGIVVSVLTPELSSSRRVGIS